MESGKEIVEARRICVLTLCLHPQQNAFSTYIFIVGAFLALGQLRVSLVAFWLFLLSHFEEKFLPPLPYNREPKRGQELFFDVGQQKSKGHSWPGAKNAPTFTIQNCNFQEIRSRLYIGTKVDFKNPLIGLKPRSINVS